MFGFIQNFFGQGSKPSWSRDRIVDPGEVKKNEEKVNPSMVPK